jgi:hypothetical protein
MVLMLIFQEYVPSYKHKKIMDATKKDWIEVSKLFTKERLNVFGEFLYYFKTA